MESPVADGGAGRTRGQRVVVRRQAALAFVRGNAELALTHLDSLRERDAWSWLDRMLRLSAQARTGRWQEAISEADGLGDAREGIPELAFVEAVARYRAGDRAGGSAACGRLLSRHGMTRNPDRAMWIVRACLLDASPLTEETANVLERLQQQILPVRLYGTPDSIAGALAVRRGRFAVAIQLLEKAASAGERTPHTSLFLAIALSRSGRIADARRAIGEADAFVWPNANVFAQGAFRSSWFGAEAGVLRRKPMPSSPIRRGADAGRAADCHTFRRSV